MLNAKLVVVGGETKTKEVLLKFPCILGRGKGSTLLLQHPLVSRQHCEIFEANGRLFVRDLGSLNGTYINNEKISEAVLDAGQLLTVGSVTFRAMYDMNESLEGTTIEVPPAARAADPLRATQHQVPDSVETVPVHQPAAEFADADQAVAASEQVEEEIGYGVSTGIPNFVHEGEEVLGVGEDQSPAEEPQYSDSPQVAPVAIPMALPALPMAIPAAQAAAEETPADDEEPAADEELADFLRSLQK